MEQNRDVRIKFWSKPQGEPGQWQISGLLPLDQARKYVSEYAGPAEIVQDEEGWPPLEEVEG